MVWISYAKSVRIAPPLSLQINSLFLSSYNQVLLQNEVAFAVGSIFLVLVMRVFGAY